MKAVLSSALLALAACQSAAHTEGPSAPAPPASVALSAPAPPAPAAAPADTLDQLDTRKPLPLLPMMAQHQKQNMREHLEVVQEIVTAAATSDFTRVAAAAKRMGYSETMGRMCEHMGAGAPGFTEQALAFHHSADRIAEAATQRDAAAVLGALGETLGKCTTCHAAYKQKLVNALPN